jgi:hypothetical protein
MSLPSSKPNRAFPHLTTSDKPTLKDVAKLVKDGKAKRIMLMVGAGVSTGAGMCVAALLVRTPCPNGSSKPG